MPSTTRAAAKKSPTRPAAKKAAPSRAAAPKAAKAVTAAKPSKAAQPAPKPTTPARAVPPAKAKFEAPAKAKFESPAQGAAREKAAKAKVRVALVRDGFTMPEADFALIATLKARALAARREAKKSELLRAGLHALAALDGAALVQALNRLEPIKTGRPKKNH